MILRKGLRLLICMLRIFNVLAEDGIDIEKNGTSNDAGKVPSFEYVEYTTISETGDEYGSFTEIEEFPEETTGIDENRFLSDYLNSNDVNAPIADTLTNDFVDELNSMETSTVDAGNEPSCIEGQGKVGNLTANADTEWVLLSWDPPCGIVNESFAYSIQGCLSYKCFEKEIKSTRFNATDLYPCADYTFTVNVIDGNDEQGVTINATTRHNIKEIGDVQHLTVNKSTDEITLSWEAPVKYPTCVVKYLITQCLKECNNTEVLDTEYVAKNLEPCEQYSFIVKTVSYEVESNGLNVKETINSPILEPPILNINEASVSANSISLSWKIKKGNGNCHLISLVTICNYTSTRGHGYEIVNGEHEEFINSQIEDEFLIVNSTVDHISPYTTYLCWAYVVNEAGNSDLSESLNVTTLEDIPSAPVLNVTNITQSEFVFVWEAPRYLAGNLHGFEITFESNENFPVPDWCSQNLSKNIIHLNETEFSFEYFGAKAYATYKAQIRAKTAAGWGDYSDYLTFQTPAGVSGAVTNFSYLITNNKNDKNILDTILTWGLPCSLNGILEYFNVSVRGTRSNYSPHSFSIKKYVPREIAKDDRIIINLKELKGEYNYTFEVFTKVYEVQELGLSANHNNILYPAGIPPQPDEEYIKLIRIDPSKARRSTASATILLPLFPDTNGDVIYYSIIVSKAEFSTASSERFNLKDRKWPNISSWEEAMLQDFTIPYQATRLRWNPYPNYVADYGDMKAVKYTLGEDTNCEEISSNTKNRVYCNGPLKPNTWYHVRMRAFTSDGYADSTTFLIKTNAEINIGLVSGVVFGILFLGILTTMMLLVRKCSPQVILRRFLHSDMSGSPVPAPFTKKKFIAHCQQLIGNPGKLSNEFQLLQTLSVDLQMPTNSACLQANKKKNRYSDILPYDFSRVKLEVIDNDPNTDYINASFIKGYTGEDEYIACQGPKEETTFDFWRMVEQYDIDIIVMLTQLVEKGKEKCHQYFPTIRETFRYENMTIKCTSELDYRSYTQRTLVLQKENKKRNITHLHFKDWPDHDVPEDFDPMIHFCQVMRRNALASKGYIVVHCSAGIGRTGTLVAIDILLQHLRDNKKLDVFGTVYRLRHHRINMVQKESQYAYIYNCIKQVLKNPYCLKTYKPPPMDPLNENASKKSKVMSNSNLNLVNNFEICM